MSLTLRLSKATWKKAATARLGSMFSSAGSVRHESTKPMVTWTIDEEDKVGTIEFQTPKALNALTVEMGHEFEALITKIEKELYEGSNVQAIVLQGAGDQAFSAGGDLDWLKSLNDNSIHANVDKMIHFYNSFASMRRKIPVPIIAALHGPAMGGAAGVAMMCDLRVVGEGARVLGFTFAKLGIPTGMGGMYWLRRSGLSEVQAAEILMLGKLLTGEEAYELGLANRLVPKDKVKEEAHALAREIAQNHPVAIRSMIRSWRLDGDAGLAEALYRDAHAQAMCYKRQDWGEGLQAIIEKRATEFDDYHSH